MMHIKGIWDFSATPDSPFKSSRETLEDNIRKLSEKIVWVKEWITLKNILEYHQWEDLPTGDVHIVIRRSRVVELKPGDHIGEACEVRLEPEMAND